MEIIDRPLSEVIKEQNIGRDLRRSKSTSQRNSNASQRNGKNNKSRPSEDRNKQRRFRQGGNVGNRGSLSQDGRRTRRFRALRDDRRGGFAMGARRREILPSRGGNVRNARRGGVDYGDSRPSRGVKSFGAARRSRISGGERNESLRRRQRESAMESTRRSRR